jgi:hypothetical protein
MVDLLDGMRHGLVRMGHGSRNWGQSLSLNWKRVEHADSASESVQAMWVAEVRLASERGIGSWDKAQHAWTPPPG